MNFTMMNYIKPRPTVAAAWWLFATGLGALVPVSANSQSVSAPALQAQPAAAERSAWDADEPAWVLSVAGGLAQGPAVMPVGINLGGPMSIKVAGYIQLDPGQAVTVSLARQWWGSEWEERHRRYPLRVELEGLWADVQRQRLSVGVVSAALSDRVEVQGMFANAQIRIAKTERTQWWLGGGVGRVKQSVTNASSVLPGCACLRAAEGSGTAWRAKLRVEWPLRTEADEGSALFMEGAYSRIPTLTSAIGTAPVTTYDAWGLRSLTMGWRLRF